MREGGAAGEEGRHPRQAVQEDGKLIFFVRNPVAEKVEVTESTGLSNVKAVADKYGGDFAVSCDAEKFQAVVML